jgi:hypothetical protein
MEAKQADDDQDSDEEFEDRLQRHRRIMGPEIIGTQVGERERGGVRERESSPCSTPCGRPSEATAVSWT